MKILIDADSCPRAARDLVMRRAEKLKVRLIFTANHPIPGAEETANVQMDICPNRENSADDRIVELADKNDLVITRDIPLAKRLVEKEITVLDDRGRVFTRDNINELLSIRNFTVGLAENGLDFERTANYGKKEFKKFADSLDRILSVMTVKISSVLSYTNNGIKC
ncbi:MAG: DUF188 domain-containing protein [Treponema sp.]|nr:DUF188 domain-containing protein [Treponema sp.]MCL2271330.1 DUF188 domain-containing protein [Treponema sp.]